MITDSIGHLVKNVEAPKQGWALLTQILVIDFVGNYCHELKSELEYYIIFFSYTISILLSTFIGNSNHLKNSSICSWKQTFLLFSNNFFRFFLPSVYAVLVINLLKQYFCENLMVNRIFKKGHFRSLGICGIYEKKKYMTHIDSKNCA